ncbi:CKAP2 protein, partial [Upupa epops]|nr:CKAP2 protein [Upupa epops]
MAARAPPQLPASRRSEPAYREQRRQKVEEYLSRKKTFSGIPIEENQASLRSRTRRTISSKMQDKIQLSTSSKPETENKENANKISWDEPGRTADHIILSASSITKANASSGTNYHPENHASKDEVTKIKPQHVLFSKSSLQTKSIKEKQLIAEKQNSTVSLSKKPVLGTYRGKVIQSKINSFRKVSKNEEEKGSLAGKKLLPSATKPAVSSLSMSSCTLVLKTTKVTEYPNSVKPTSVLPFQSKPPVKVAVSSQSHVKKQQLTSASAPKKVADQKPLGGKGPQPAPNNSDRRVLARKKGTDCFEDTKPDAPAKPVSIVPSTKSGQNIKTNGNRKSLLPKESVDERRARLNEWRASKGKVMRRPPICMCLVPQSRIEEQEFSSGDSLEHLLHSEKVKKTLTECLQLTEQGCQGDEVRAMLKDLTHSIPGVKKLAKYWICCMHLEQMGPLEKLIIVYEEAILAGATPKDDLRHTLIDIMKNTESLSRPENGRTATEGDLSDVVEVSKEPNSSVEQVQEAFSNLCCDDDQKTESEDKKAEPSSEVVVKEEMGLDLKPREETLPKKKRKHRNKDRAKKKGKLETEEQNEDGVKDTVQAVNSPEKENDTSCLTKYNPPATPYLASVKMHHEANDSSATDLKIVTPLRYSQRLREKMCKPSDNLTDQDPCVSPLEQSGELESKATTIIHVHSDVVKETSAEADD